MTATDLERLTKSPVVLRVEYSLDMETSEGLRLSHVNQVLVDTEALLWVVAFEGWHHDALDGRFDAAANTFVSSARIRRISYNSPFEIVLGFAAGLTVVSTTAAVVASRLESVFGAYNRIRVNWKSADLQIAAMDVLRRELNVAREPTGATELALRQADKAAEVLSQVQSIEILET